MCRVGIREARATDRKPGWTEFCLQLCMQLKLPPLTQVTAVPTGQTPSSCSNRSCSVLTAAVGCTASGTNFLSCGSSIVQQAHASPVASTCVRPPSLCWTGAKSLRPTPWQIGQSGCLSQRLRKPTTCSSTRRACGTMPQVCSTIDFLCVCMRMHDEMGRRQSACATGRRLACLQVQPARWLHLADAALLAHVARPHLMCRRRRGQLHAPAPACT